MVQNYFTRYKKSQLHYVKAGNGNQTLLFFHGFGQDHSVYIPIIQSLADRYTLYIFDLYFHGQSTWAHDEQPLEKDHWKETMLLFLNDNKIEDFSLVGYSLGGKFAMATMEAFPEKIIDLFLIAPDGIKTSFWYSLATYPAALRRFFKSMIQKHNRFLKIASALNKLRIVDKGLIRFADFQMNTEEKRRRVYFTWVVFRHLSFDLPKLAELIRVHRIRLVIVVGKYDKVITAENMKRFTNIVPNAKLEIVEAGHNNLLTKKIFEEYMNT